MNQMEDVIRMLDTMTQAGVSRIKVETSGTLEEGRTEKAYHHGRCDVGSPFATGKLFDLGKGLKRSPGPGSGPA